MNEILIRSDIKDRNMSIFKDLTAASSLLLCFIASRQPFLKLPGVLSPAPSGGYKKALRIPIIYSFTISNKVMDKKLR